MSNEHERGIAAAMEAGTPKGIRDRRSHRERVEDSISAYLSALAPQPVGDAEAGSLLIRNLVGVVRKLCKHLPTTDMTRMEAEDFLRRNNLYGSVFRVHPCTSTPVVSQNAPDLEDKGEPVAWESTTTGYIKYVTDSRYQKFSDEVKRWYKPYRCSHCATTEVDANDE